MGSVGTNMPTALQSDVVANICAAVAQAVRAPESDSGWAGVAGSRLFTQRVKEYRGPMSEFASWAKAFKSNIPRLMREAVECAEDHRDNITAEVLAQRSADTPRWNEEAWRLSVRRS